MRRNVLIIAIMLAASSVNAKVIATVGQDTITQEDVNKLKKQIKEANPWVAESITDDDLMNQIIDIRVGILDAKTQGLDQRTEAKQAMDSALFNYYTYIMVDSSYNSKKFSKKEIVDYYNANPVIKFQRILVPFNPNNEGKKEKLYTKLSVLRSDLRSKKVTFEQAIEKLGDDTNPDLSGTFDKVAAPSLYPAEASELKGLAPQEISPIITADNFFSIIKIIKIYPFSADYSEPINQKLKAETIAKARAAYFKSLRQKYSAYVKIQ